MTLSPQRGNEGVRIYETASGMINRIGLENIGIDAFLEFFRDFTSTIIVNVAGKNVEDYVLMGRKCEKAQVKLIELNLSCPNVSEGCIEFGSDASMLSNVVSKFRENFSGYLIVKLTPNVTCPEAIAIAAQEAGADAISAINTVRGLGVKLSYSRDVRKFDKVFIQGGLSGKAIKPIALSFIKRISKEIDIPIIGMGGINSLEDIFEFFACGAKAVEIGTCNFTHPNICERLIDDLEKFMKENSFETLEDLRRCIYE